MHGNKVILKLKILFGHCKLLCCKMEKCATRNARLWPPHKLVTSGDIHRWQHVVFPEGNSEQFSPETSLSSPNYGVLCDTPSALNATKAGSPMGSDPGFPRANLMR